MFGFKIITKTEQLIWQRQINDLREEIAELKKQAAYERHRADKAVNLVLARKTGMAIDLTGPDAEEEAEKMQNFLEDSMNLFEPDETTNAAETAEERREREQIAEIQGVPAE
jgi:cell division septum initiation protein DivIVA